MSCQFPFQHTKAWPRVVKNLDQITGQMADMHIDVMDEDDNYV